MNGGTPTITAAEYRRMAGLDKARRENGRPGLIAGKGRLPRQGRSYGTEDMNKTEAAYAARLDALLACGDILAWKYASHKFRLADRTWYTPDFEVVRADGRLEMHEVKGHWEDDARVKIKAASEQFRWYRFLAVKYDKGAWTVENFGGTHD